MSWTLNDITSLEGKTFIVTGANSGLGYEITRILTQNDAQVIMACRNPEKAQEAQRKLGGNTVIELLNLSSLDSIRDFTARVNQKYPTLDCLINNAGIMMTPFGLTEDGVELQFGTNHLGHFALTSGLLPALNRGKAARVISVSSVAHRRGKLEYEEMNTSKRYNKIKAYAASKLANLVFMVELARRLEEAGSLIRSIGAHPGWSATNLFEHAAIRQGSEPLDGHASGKGCSSDYSGRLGDRCTEWRILRPTGFMELWGDPGKAVPTKYALDPGVGTKLWLESERLVGEPFFQLAEVPLSDSKSEASASLTAK